MKNNILILLIAVAIISVSLNACNNNQNTNIPRVDTVYVEINPPYPTTETYYETIPDKKVVIANPIICQFNVKNYNPDDDWTEQCLSQTNTQALAACILQAVIKGKLQAFDFITEQPLTIDQVKKIDKSQPRNAIGQIQFEEQWYFDETKPRLYKKVVALTWGYEKQKGTDEKGFVPAFRVVFPDNK